MEKKKLVIDVGGTRIKYATISDDLTLSEVTSVATDLSGLDGYMAQLESIYREVEKEVDGIAMSVPGVLDHKTGFMKSGGNLTFIKDMPFSQELSKQLGKVRVTIENDAKAAGYAELVYGALQNVNNGVVCVLGTGIGGCTIVDRKIVRGFNNFAGEYSYLITPELPIGDITTDDNFVGYSNGIGALFSSYEKYMELPADSVDGYTFFEAANTGDKTALRVLRSYCRSLVLSLVNIQTVIDPEVIAIGGGISVQPLVLETIQEEYRKFISIDKLSVIGMRSVPEIVVCKFNNEANLIGAYCNFRELYPID
ncbi:MAG: ROK family protein [Oscillospiraceae bacterium]|nr:ROK family protein [Oscillospiraceae bacterium]